MIENNNIFVYDEQFPDTSEFLLQFKNFANKSNIIFI